MKRRFKEILRFRHSHDSALPPRLERKNKMECRLSACLRHDSAWSFGWIVYSYSAFIGLSVILRYLVNMNIMICALGVQTRNANFLETSFTRRTDFIVLQCSATNRALPYISWYRVQENSQGQSYMRKYVTMTASIFYFSLSHVRSLN
jgi:hypothetical protein